MYTSINLDGCVRGRGRAGEHQRRRLAKRVLFRRSGHVVLQAAHSGKAVLALELAQRVLMCLVNREAALVQILVHAHCTHDGDALRQVARWNASSQTLEPVREESLPPKGREKIQNRTRRVSTILARATCCSLTLWPIEQRSSNAHTGGAVLRAARREPRRAPAGGQRPLRWLLRRPHKYHLRAHRRLLVRVPRGEGVRAASFTTIRKLPIVLKCRKCTSTVHCGPLDDERRTGSTAPTSTRTARGTA